MESPNYLALIGYRKAAAQAAKQLGYSVLVWSDKPLPKSAQALVTQAYLREFPKPQEKLSQGAIQFFRPFNVTGFIALTEASVLATALLRIHFKHPSITGNTAACHDKYLMKQLAQTGSILVTDYQLAAQVSDPDQLIEHWGFPIFVKPRASSGSRNVTKITRLAQLKSFKGTDYLLEKAIRGTEMSAEFFVHNHQLAFLNITEYYSPLEINIIPAQAQLVDHEQVKNLAQQVISTFALNHCLVHLEFFKTTQGLVLGEFAIRPPGGYLMEGIGLAYEFDPWQAYTQNSLGNSPDLPNHIPQRYLATWVYHPGHGHICAIQGAEALQSLPSFLSLKLKKEIGDLIDPRTGTGQDVAKLLFANPSYEQLVIDIERARALFSIVIQQ